MFRSRQIQLNVAQSMNYSLKLEQSGFKWHAKKILGFERFLSKIGDIEKNCLLMMKSIWISPLIIELATVLKKFLNHVVCASFLF